MLSEKSEWTQARDQLTDWSSWLAEADNPQDLEVLRRNVEKGLPCGTDKFIQDLEKIAGRVLQYRPIGRPKKRKG